MAVTREFPAESALGASTACIHVTPSPWELMGGPVATPAEPVEENVLHAAG